MKEQNSDSPKINEADAEALNQLRALQNSPHKRVLLQLLWEAGGMEIEASTAAEQERLLCEKAYELLSGRLWSEGRPKQRDATRAEVIAWAKENARDGFWSKDLMKFPPPEGWAWCGDQPPYHLTHIAFCDSDTWSDVLETDLGKG
jgi:hypothetical protein